MKNETEKNFSYTSIIILNVYLTKCLLDHLKSLNSRGLRPIFFFLFQSYFNNIFALSDAVRFYNRRSRYK